MAWSDFFLPSNAQTSDEAQANLARETALFNQRLADRKAAGTISDEEASSYEQFLSSVYLEDQNAAASEGFLSGLHDSFNGLLDKGKSAFSALSPSIWGIVVLAGIALFIWAGGLGLIKGILKRK